MRKKARRRKREARILNMAYVIRRYNVVKGRPVNDIPYPEEFNDLVYFENSILRTFEEFLEKEVKCQT